MSVEINATNFPDTTFRAYVSAYDSNSDGILSDGDIANIVALNISSVESLSGLEFLTSVKTCVLRYPGASIGISSQSLETFEITSRGTDSTIVNLSFTNCPKLISINIPWQYAIETLTVSDCPSLEWLDAYGPDVLTTVSLNNCNNLRGINLWGASQVANLNVSNFKKLEVLRFDHAKLSNLNVTGCSKLKYLFASNNYQIDDETILDLTGCEALRIVKFDGHRYLRTVKLPSYAPDLHTLDIGRGDAVILNISACPLLINLVQNQSSPSNVNWGSGSPHALRYGPAQNPKASEQGVDTYPLVNEAKTFSNYDLSLTYPIQGTIVYLPILITQQPEDLLIQPEDAGGYFTVNADGSDLKYSWEIKLSSDETWTQLESSENSNQFYVANESENNGAKVRCRVHNNSASIYSNEAQFIVLAAPILVTQPPASIEAHQGSSVSFSMEALGYDLSYEWQVSTDDGNTWHVNSMFYSNEYWILATLDTDGYRFRCRVFNDLGEVYTNVTILSVIEATRTTTPSMLTLVEGQNGEFAIDPGEYDRSYQWQVSNDNGATWTDIRYATDVKYDFLASISVNGNQYRCAILFSSDDIVYSSPSTLTVTADQSLAPPTITTHPSSLEITEGNNATFSVVASGNNLSYQWQTYKNGTWYNINGANSASYTTLASRSLNGNQYRCQVSNAAGGVYSNTATLTVTLSAGSISTPSIRIQPRSANVNDGQTAIFSLTADGGGLSYQWYIKRNGQWYPISGAMSAIYSVIGRSANNGTQYRCLVTNSAGSVYSNVIDLNVQSSAPLSFYGYHSIIISGKNTYGEWEMYPTSRPHVAPPEVKTSYVDVPGADGGLDYTDLLTGEPRFGYRKGSWEFLLIPQERWPDVYRSLCNFLNGRVHTVVLEDDPTWQYTGRLSVNKWESAAHNSLITIDYILDPNPVNLDDESYNTDEDDLAAAARILRKPGNEGMVIGMFNGSATVVDPATYFEDGDNISY